MATILYDFDPNGLVSTGGAPVPALVDSIGGVVSLLQATVGSQPTFSTTGQQINGRNTLVSDGARWMATGVFTNVFPATISFVYNGPVETGGFQPTVAWQAGPIYGDNWGLYVHDGANPLGHRVQAGTHIMVVVANGASSELWVDGQLSYIGALDLTSLTNLGFFTNDPASFAFGTQGQFARMRVFSGAMSDVEVKAETMTLAVTYGTTASIDTATTVNFSVATGTLPISGRNFLVHIPAGYSGSPTPLAVFCHGSGGNCNDIWRVTSNGVNHDAFLVNGCLVAALDLSTTFTPTTLQSDLDAITEFLAYLKSTYAVSKTIMSGQSRGSTPSLLTAANSTRSQVSGWLGLSPALADSWYGTSTAPLSLLHRAGSDFQGLFMRYMASIDDTTAVTASNSTPMAAITQGFALENIIQVTTGVHGDILNYSYPDEKAFVARILAPSSSRMLYASIGRQGIRAQIL